MQIIRKSGQSYAFVARALVRRGLLQRIGWEIHFDPATQEPWNRYDHWKFEFGPDDTEANNVFWTPFGVWRATANAAALSPENAIEIYLNPGEEVVATLTAPNQIVEFRTGYSGNNPQMHARLTGAPLPGAEVGLYYLEEFVTSGQVPRIKALDEFLVVEYPDSWDGPRPGVLTATPHLYDAAGVLLATGDMLTLTAAESDGGAFT